MNFVAVGDSTSCKHLSKWCGGGRGGSWFWTSYRCCFEICHISCWSKLQPSSKTIVLNARFIRTVCMRRIRWSCEGLTSVHNEYTGYTLKHLLLRHMYNLSLPMLKCYLLKPGDSETSYCWSGSGKCYCWSVLWWNAPTLYCVVPYMAACVDVSRTVFWDRS